MIRFKSILLVLLLVFTPAILLAESPLPAEKKHIYVIVKDMEGNVLDGYLLLYPEEVTVSTKDNKEKSIPVNIIESIQVEKKQGALPEVDRLGGESYYSVRLQDSREILTLEEKYTLSFKTSVGVVTKNLDPEAIKHSSERDSTLAKPESNEPLIRDQSVIFSLELRF
jgi:hypothetical protein